MKGDFINPNLANRFSYYLILTNLFDFK